MELAFWLIGITVLLLFLARGGDEILLAYVKAPIGVGTPVVLFILFVSVEQMRGMMTATLGGYDSGGQYSEHWFHQLGVPVAVVVLALQCWFWTLAVLNAVARRRDSDMKAALPFGETWAIRIAFFASACLGILPFYVVGGWTPWTSTEVPWVGITLSALLTLGVWACLRRRRQRISAQPHSKALPDGLVARVFVCAPWGPGSAIVLLGIAILAVLTPLLAPDFVDDNLHTTSAVLFAASCYVPLATLLLVLLRDGSRRVLEYFGCRPERAVPIASGVGFALLVLVPFGGSSLAGVFGAYDVPQPAGTPGPRAASRSVASFPNLACKQLPGSPPVIVAIAGGASRSAAWSLSAMRMLDVASKGAFSRQLVGMSTVSGGSLAAMTYAMTRSQLNAENMVGDHFVRGMVELARFDLLPATAARLFSIDLLLGVPTRGGALANAFDSFWRRHVTQPVSFAKAVEGDCMPHVLLNGVDVLTGSRLLTSSLQFSDVDQLGAFAYARDVRSNIEGEFPAAAAVLNSARFPIVSPPGQIVLKQGGGRELHVIDGGVYEASGISTAIELSELIRHGNPGLKPILVIISNDGSPHERAKHNLCDPVNADELEKVRKEAKAAKGEFPVPEIMTSLAGLNATRTTRYFAELARSRAMFCGADPRDRRVFVLDLPSPPNEPNEKTKPVPMNWVLTAQDCRFLLGRARRSGANLDNAVGLAQLLANGSGEFLDKAGLEMALDGLKDAERCGQQTRAQPG